MNKELEKAAKEYSRNGNYQFMSTFQQMAETAFIAGAKWQVADYGLQTYQSCNTV